MYIYNQHVLQDELLKVQETIHQKDAEKMKYLFEYYISHLKCSPDQYVTNGFLVVFSPDISYHLLSVHFILDYIDHYYDGEKIVDKHKKKPLLLQKELLLSHYHPFPPDVFPFLTEDLSKLIKLTKQKLHVLFLPYKNPTDSLIEYTILGDILVIFSDSDTRTSSTFHDNPAYLDILLQGVSSFYIKKELKGHLPFSFKQEKDFHEDFLSWFKGNPSRYFHL